MQWHAFLACLDEVQEELLYYAGIGVGVGVGGGIGVNKMFNFKSFLCDGQGAVRQAILSLWQVLIHVIFSIALLLILAAGSGQ